MKFNLSQEKPKVKLAVLLELIPAFTAIEIEEMTGLSDRNIGYYRRRYKPQTFSSFKKNVQAEAERNVRDQIEHKQEYALSVVEDILHDNGIPYE